MTKRIFAIAVLVYAAFLLEFVLYNTFGTWGKPAFMLLAVIFCNLYWGIRYSLWAAVVAGTFKDAFGSDPFGTYNFIYIFSAYLATFIRQSVYQPGSRFSRVLVAILVLGSMFVLETVLHMRFFEVRLKEAFIFIFLPQAIVTAISATFVFHRLRDLVVQLKL